MTERNDSAVVDLLAAVVWRRRASPKRSTENPPPGRRKQAVKKTGCYTECNLYPTGVPSQEHLQSICSSWLSVLYLEFCGRRQLDSIILAESERNYRGWLKTCEGKSFLLRLTHIVIIILYYTIIIGSLYGRLRFIFKISWKNIDMNVQCRLFSLFPVKMLDSIQNSLNALSRSGNVLHRFSLYYWLHYYHFCRYCW